LPFLALAALRFDLFLELARTVVVLGCGRLVAFADQPLQVLVE
jgi:hypothetical protein